MKNLFKILIRTSSFLRKEVFEVLRQPRLLLTLIVGPFLILLIFGLGFIGGLGVIISFLGGRWPNSPFQNFKTDPMYAENSS